MRLFFVWAGLCATFAPERQLAVASSPSETSLPKWSVVGASHVRERTVSARFWPTHGGGQASHPVHIAAHLRSARSSANGGVIGGVLDVSADVEEEVEEGLEHAEETAESVGSAPQKLPEEAEHDAQLFRYTFLPNWHPNTWVLLCALGFATFGLLWIVVYLRWIYESDRVEHLGRWKDKVHNMDALEQDENLLFGMLHKDRFVNHTLTPDIAVVFHHPTHEAHSHATDDEVSDDVLHNVLVQRGNDYHELKEFKNFAELAHEGSDAQVAKECGRKLTMRLAREVLLKDLYNFIPHQGFEEKIFQSIDHDELIVCISLTQDNVMDHYLRVNNIKLQVQAGVVEALGVSQPREDPHSSPPHIPYDPSLVTAFAELEVIKEDDPRQMYVTHYGRDGAGNIMNGQDRIRVIYREITKYVNLDAAKHQGLIADWYPVHSYKWLHKLGASWSCFRHISDMTFVQPVTLLNTYFGSRVAFSFAWNGLYCKMLLPLALLACLVAPLTQLRRIDFFHGSVDLVHQAMSLSFTVVLLTWAKVASNLWNREERFFMKLWNLNPDTATPNIRPEFVGFLRPSQADLNKLELGQNNQKFALRCWASTIICVIASACVAVLIFMWLTIFEGKLNLVAGVALSLQIVILQNIFNRVARSLTEWENHHFQKPFYESYLRKVVGLQFVNNYTAFFYLAVRQRYSDAGCPEGGCLQALRRQLTVSLLILSAARIGEVLFACVKVRWVLWKETNDLRKQLGGAEPPMRSFAEEQSKYVEYRTQEQIEAFSSLMISLGFVLIFGGVCPVIIPFCFVVFVVQLRAGAFQLTTTTKRPVPRITFGIGAWTGVINFMMQIGVLFSAFLVVEYGEYFKGAPLITKVTGFMLFCSLIVIVWRIVDTFLSESGDEGTAILLARRRAVEQSIAEASVDERKMLCTTCLDHDKEDGGGFGDNQQETTEEDKVWTNEEGAKDASPRAVQRRLRRTSSRFQQIVKDLEPHDAVRNAVEHGDWEVIPRLDQEDCEEHMEKVKERANSRLNSREDNAFAGTTSMTVGGGPLSA